MNSKQPTDEGVLENLQQRRDSIPAISQAASQFQPTDLDLALERDPVAEATRRAFLVASGKDVPPPDDQSDTTTEPSLPASPVEPANRHGQMKAAAASLAGGMIAAEGRPVTAAEAVEKVTEVMEELKRWE